MINLFGGIGKIETVSKDGLCSIKFYEDDDMVVNEIQYLSKHTFNKKTYTLPEVGEEVFCVFLGQNMERGFAIGSFFSEVNTKPDGADLEKVIASYPGAGKLTWDMKQGFFELETVNKITLTTPEVEINGSTKITFNSPEISMNGGSSINLTAPSIKMNGGAMVDIVAPNISVSGGGAVNITTSNLGIASPSTIATGVITAVDVITARGSVSAHIHTETGVKTLPMNE